MVISVEKLQNDVYSLHFAKKVKLSFININLFKDKLNEIKSSNLKGLIINCKNLEFIDSSGISVLVSFIKYASKRGVWLKICEVNEDMKKIFEMIKLGRLVEIADTEDEILEKMEIVPIQVYY